MRRPEQTLEEMLGRLLDPADRGSVPTFNDLPPRLVEEARGLVCGSRLAVTEYLRFYVQNTDLSDSFIREVLESGTVEAAEWGKNDTACYPCARAARWATLDVQELIAPLAGVVGERWFGLVPILSSWEGSGIVGAPCVVVRAAPYWFEPAPTIDYGDIAGEPVEAIAVADLEVALRRWIASRVAWGLRRHLATHVVESMSQHDVCAALGLDAEQLSHDAKLAIRGLLASGWPKDVGSAVPGFTGADELYLP